MLSLFDANDKLPCLIGVCSHNAPYWIVSVKLLRLQSFICSLSFVLSFWKKTKQKNISWVRPSPAVITWPKCTLPRPQRILILNKRSGKKNLEQKVYISTRHPTPFLEATPIFRGSCRPRMHLTVLLTVCFFLRLFLCTIRKKELKLSFAEINKKQKKRKN